MTEDGSKPVSPGNNITVAAASYLDSNNQLSTTATTDVEIVPPPPPPPPQAPPSPVSQIRPVIRTPEFTASPSIASINTTPRQSGKQYGRHQLNASSSSSNSDRKLNNVVSTSYSKASNTSNSSALQSNDNVNIIGDNKFMNMNYPQLLTPCTKYKPISQCSLLCCFYAEFDNTVGSKICYQYPYNFMEQDINTTCTQFEILLENSLSQSVSNENVSSIATTSELYIPEAPPVISDQTPKASGGQQSKLLESKGPSPTQPIVTSSITSTDSTKNNKMFNHSLSNSNNTGSGSTSSSNDSSSIFDSCSEYIITGSELTGNIINLSTHHIHLVTRPTMMIDETYERNTLLFSVGFVLRRTIDPQPYRPILSKLALTLRDMEIESQYLSNKKEQVQSILEGIVRSVNSYDTLSECNILLGPADAIHLKLFRPPKPHVIPVNDYSVPILIRRDWLHQGVRLFSCIHPR
jgi:hypothetical protein